jgi:general secretion pathway protein B
MSSILKALKKLEQEKTARREHQLDISRDILKGGERHRRPGWWTLLATGLGGALIAVLVTVSILKKHDIPPGVTEGSSSEKAAASSQPLTPSIPALPPEETVKNNATSLPQRAADHTHPKPVDRARPAAPSAPASTIPPPESASLPASGAAPPVVPAKMQIPLEVSGIAFQQEAGPPIAVINGHPVSAGATIDGAFIVKILPDKVMFTRDGSSFEVQVGETYNGN